MILRTAPFLVALLTGLLILAKVVIYPDCYSFDVHDDSNHAFPGLHVARIAILSGELPTINFFNNFGAPLLGDALTYPFALQSLPYYFLENSEAMTLNRFIVAITTILAAFGFFRLFLGVFPALICALLTFFNPVAFWYPVHQYQMASLFFFVSLIAIDKFILAPTRGKFFLLALLFCMLILSVSINLVVFMLPFLFTWCLSRNRFRLNRVTMAPAVAFLCASIFTYIQTVDFVRNFLLAARGDEGVYESILTNVRELFLGLIIPPGEWIAYNYGAQMQVTTYLSMPVILGIVIGAFLIGRKPVWKQASLFLCGIVPTLIALLLYINTSLRFSLPLLRSVDITRVFWFSLPFCYVYVGYLIGYTRHYLLPKWALVFLVLVPTATIIALRSFAETSEISALHSITLLLVLVGALLMLFSRLVRLGSYLIIGSFLLIPIPIAVRVLGLNDQTCKGTQYSDTLSASRLSPNWLLDHLERGNRLATEIHTHHGQDLRAAAYGILGSGARAIAVDKKFGKFLESKNLVTVDQIPYGYYFSRPWKTEELTDLGIRYLLVERTQDPELESQNWRTLAGDGRFSLYENPNRPTPVYLLTKTGKSPIFINSYELLGNHIRIQLPEVLTESTLVVSILNRYGFEAQIDGSGADFVPQDNGFIGLNVSPGSRSIDIRHRPYSWFQVAIGWVAAVLIGLLYGWFLPSLGVRRES